MSVVFAPKRLRRFGILLFGLSSDLDICCAMGYWD